MKSRSKKKIIEEPKTYCTVHIFQKINWLQADQVTTKCKIKYYQLLSSMIPLPFNKQRLSLLQALPILDIIKMVLAYSRPLIPRTLWEGIVNNVVKINVVYLLFCIWNLLKVGLRYKGKKWPFSTLSLNSKCRQCNFWNVKPR